MPRQPNEAKGRVLSFDTDTRADDGEGLTTRTKVDGHNDALGGHVSDTRGNAMFESGGPQGYRSVDFENLTRHMANISYWENKAFYMSKSAEQKQEENATARYKRSQRGWCDVRMDSINRVAVRHYKKFLQERDPSYLYGSDEDIAEIEGLDNRTAQSLGLRWREEEDIRKFNAFIARYAAWLEGKPDVKVINQRFRRNEAQKRLAESVFVCDALAVGITFAWAFDADELLRYVGDELWLQMKTERSDRERRSWLIHEAENSFYQKGALFPAFVNVGLLETMEEVSRLIDGA